RLDLVFKIYRLLRNNIVPETDTNVDTIADSLRVDNGIPIWPPVETKPNQITYNSMIQILAYHGYFTEAINVFIDMMSSDNLEEGAPLVRDETGQLRPVPYRPNLIIFRALFLGFSRHGIHVPKDDSLASRLNSQRSWTLTDLESLYDTFLTIADEVRPTVSTIYWIMVAFDITSGHDVLLLRKIWKELEEKFNGPWGGRDNRLRILKDKLFAPDHEAFPYFHRYGFRV
ncbi:hypothetical protein C8J56DRAFT_751325, partial [Mycena floridula]